ncbi:MAG TPA: nuclear transport factor 2 family protein [Candidatus Sulfotelmatobacter sp.]|jgi:predicted SnoaL-like aldol condensation-catalyzing enzyme
MSDVSVQTLSPEKVVSEALRHLNQEQIEDASACFTANCRYQDHGIGLKFTEKEGVTEFFRKARELYPDYFVRTDQTLVSGEHVITQWTLQVTVNEPFYAGLTRRVPVSIAGASIVRIENGKIAEWDEYYDGLTARRTALAAHFTEWIEY